LLQEIITVLPGLVNRQTNQNISQQMLQFCVQPF